MRLSVMELGRFTLQGGSGGQPATNLIILHAGGERNVRSGQKAPDECVRGYMNYFGEGAVLSVLAALLGCLAMIRSLILS